MRHADGHSAALESDVGEALVIRTAGLRGSLRVAMPQGFGVREIIPLPPEFPARHPALNLSFSMSDQRKDAIKEGVDLSPRLGALADSSATARLMS